MVHLDWAFKRIIHRCVCINGMLCQKEFPLLKYNFPRTIPCLYLLLFYRIMVTHRWWAIKLREQYVTKHFYFYSQAKSCRKPGDIIFFVLCHFIFDVFFRSWKILQSISILANVFLVQESVILGISCCHYKNILTILEIFDRCNVIRLPQNLILYIWNLDFSCVGEPCYVICVGMSLSTSMQT